MIIKTLTTKLLDRFLRVTNIYSFIFRRENYEIRSPKRLEIHEPKLNYKERDNVLVSKTFNNSQSEFDELLVQTNRPFWKVTWKDFDPKDFWETARGWQWLREIVFAKNKEETEKVIEKITSWLEDNPYPNGLAWAVGLDVAIRAINLAIIYSITKEEQFEKFLYEHYLYLRKMLWLSKNAIKNNHYLGELTALTILSKMFNKKNTDDLKKQLKEEIENQFYKDGVNFEQSIRYHKFSLEFVILAKVFLGIKTEIIKKSGRFLMATMKPDRTWPSIGDDDLGCVIRLHNEPLKKDYLGILNLVTALEKASKLKTISGNISAETNLLLKNPEEKLGTLQEAIPEKTQIFPKGGFLIHRTGWGENDSYLLIKFGPHKWHAHADLFHLELSINGINVLTDSGTYRYNNVPEYRKYFRSTKAHNTLEFDEKDQTKQWTTFRWHKPAKVIDWGFSSNEDNIIFKASHNGYKNQKIIHKRVLDFDKSLKKIVVKDTLTGKGKGRSKIFWHFDPEITLEKINKTEFNITFKNKKLGRISIESEETISTKLTKTPFSRYYGHLSEKPTLCIEYEKSNSKSVVTTNFEFK